MSSNLFITFSTHASNVFTKFGEIRFIFQQLYFCLHGEIIEREIFLFANVHKRFDTSLKRSHMMCFTCSETLVKF